VEEGISNSEGETDLCCTSSWEGGVIRKEGGKENLLRGRSGENSCGSLTTAANKGGAILPARSTTFKEKKRWGRKCRRRFFGTPI